jgi:hypothetical protein
MMPPSSEIVEAVDVEERDDVFEPLDDADGESDDCGDVDESSQRDPIEEPDARPCDNYLDPRP